MKPELMGNTPPEIMMKKYAIQMLELQIAEIYKSMEVEQMTNRLTCVLCYRVVWRTRENAKIPTKYECARCARLKREARGNVV